MSKNTKIILTCLIIILAIIAIVEVAMILKTKKQNNNIVEYKVTFMTDEMVYKEETVKAGEYVKRPSDPAKEKFAFVEWRYEGKIFDFSMPVNSDITLNAIWKEVKDKETITVKFDTDGGTTYPNQIIEKGKKVEKPKDPIKEGYTFIKWVVENKEFDFDTILEKDTTITAIWEQKEENKPTENKPNNNTDNNTNSSSTIKVKKPTLSIAGGDINQFDLSIGVEGVYASGYSEIDGWELGEVVSGAIKKFGSYTSFKSVTVKLEPGEERTFVARVYKTDSKGNKVYSEFSNQVKHKREILTPTLTIAGGDSSKIQLSIAIEGAYADGHDTIKGWELGEIIGGTIKKFGSYTDFRSVDIPLEPGQERIFVAKVYAVDSKGNKVYSEFSNQVKHKREVLAPTLTAAAGDSSEIQLSIAIEGAYADENSSISGWELYEKVNGSFTKFGEYTNLNSATVPLEPGQKRIFKARVYVRNSNGEKIYSSYSNEVTNP